MPTFRFVGGPLDGQTIDLLRATTYRSAETGDLFPGPKGDKIMRRNDPVEDATIYVKTYLPSSGETYYRWVPHPGIEKAPSA